MDEPLATVNLGGALSLIKFHSSGHYSCIPPAAAASIRQALGLCGASHTCNCYDYICLSGTKEKVPSLYLSACDCRLCLSDNCCVGSSVFALAAVLYCRTLWKEKFQGDPPPPPGPIPSSRGATTFLRAKMNLHTGKKCPAIFGPQTLG